MKDVRLKPNLRKTPEAHTTCHTAYYSLQYTVTSTHPAARLWARASCWSSWRPGAGIAALTCGVLDYQNETPLEDVLASIERPTSRVGASLSRGGEAEVFDLELDGVRLTLLPTAFSRAERAPSAREAALFLDLADQVLARFRPEILLTYGGHPASRELMRRARAHGTAVVFHLHNFGYNDRRRAGRRQCLHLPVRIFATSYARRVGLDGTVIPYAIPLRKIVASCQLSVVSSQLLNASDCAAVVGSQRVSSFAWYNGPLTTDHGHPASAGS